MHDEDPYLFNPLNPINQGGDCVDGREIKLPDPDLPEPFIPIIEPPDYSYENFTKEQKPPKNSDPYVPLKKEIDTYFPPYPPLNLASETTHRSIRSSALFTKLLEGHYMEKLNNDIGPDISITPPSESKPEKSGPTLDDIGGYDEAKEQVRKFLAAAQHPEAFKQWGVKPPKGLLFYGPPGTGKTMFAKAIATELDGHFEAISPADINKKYFGESEELVKKLFEDARKRPGHTVIFIDEIESMLPQRDTLRSGGVRDSIMTMFLQYMDGNNSPDNVTIVGATNRLDAIDAAVLRPGRFDRKIEIGYPDPEARAAILDIHIKALETGAGRKLFDIDADALDRLLRGADILTGAQIAEVVRRVGEAKAYESIGNDDMGLATVDDLVDNFASLIAETARYDT
jgi:SpoVK/Ycf46/Vps4 family AAA+-type ATPase